MKDILVVGGAGYIGSHMCKRLADQGYRPIVLDNLSRGHRQAIRWGPFFHGSMSDGPLIKRIFADFEIVAVMHFAAFCYVGESVEAPLMYYQNNVAETLSLLSEMIHAGVERLIFSSSCAVYGEPRETPISEDHPLSPINPYGRTKWMVEQIIEDFRRVYGLKFVSLRYFNAAGADAEGELGEDHRPETHLIPLILQVALKQQKEARVFGDDYPTEDGTCIRDYVHVEDLAQAHLRALERLLAGGESGIYNLGNGTGYSVKQVIETASRITGRRIPVRISPRRPGDPAVLTGAARKAFEDLGWRPKYADLSAIIETAWRWHTAHPVGYPPAVSSR